MAGDIWFAVMVAADPRRGSLLVGDRRVSSKLFSGGVLTFEPSFFRPGDFARLADSRNQCLKVAN